MGHIVAVALLVMGSFFFFRVSGSPAVTVSRKQLHIFCLSGCWIQVLNVWFITECWAVTHSVLKLCHHTAGNSHLQLFSHSSKMERGGRLFGFSNRITRTMRVLYLSVHGTHYQSCRLEKKKRVQRS